MAVSTIQAIKSALKTRLDADTDLSGVQITWGNPYPTKPEEEQIIIGPATQTELPAGLGNNGIEEAYTIDIIVSVQRSARESFETLETRAFVIAGHIELSVVDWRSESPVFSGINGWIQASAITTAEALATNDQGQVTEREASVTITLSIVARK